MESISNELSTLENTYKAAFKSTNDYKKQLDSELQGQKHTKWELEHQTKRATDYKANVAKMTQEMAELKYRLPKIGMSCLSSFFFCLFEMVPVFYLSIFPVTTEVECRLCPPGWIWFNSVCYFFPFDNYLGSKSWSKAREFCQMYGGDLAVIDSKEKEVGGRHFKGRSPTKLSLIATVLMGRWGASP